MKPLYFNTLVIALTSFLLSPHLSVGEPIQLPNADWAFEASAPELAANEAVWIELRDAQGERLYRLGLNGNQAILQHWKSGDWVKRWNEKRVDDIPYDFAVIRVGNRLFFEAGGKGVIRAVEEINASQVPVILDGTVRRATDSQAAMSNVSYRTPLREAAEESPPATITDTAFACYLPWFPADYTALGYQRQYDFPVIPLLPNPDYDNVTAQYEIMHASGIDVVSADIVFFNTDRVRAGAVIFKRLLDSIPGDGSDTVKIVPMLELKDIDAAIDGTIYLLDRFGDDPRWFKIDGRPFILTYHNGAHMDMTPELWTKLTSKVRASGFDPVWIYNFGGIKVALSGTVDLDEAREIAKVSDGVFHFSGSSLTDAGRFPGYARQHLGDDFPDLIVGGSIHQGYYSNRTYNRNVISNRHTAELREMWNFVKAGNPDFVHLTTWNDYNEATTFCPSYSDIGARLEIVQRMLSDYFKQPLPKGKSGEPELVLSYRKEMYPGEPLELEVLPLPSELGPKKGRVTVIVKTASGETLMEETSPEIDFTSMEPWYCGVDIPSDFPAPTVLRISATYQGAKSSSIDYANLPDIFIAQTSSYGDQLYYSIPLHRLAKAADGLSIVVNGVGQGKVTGSGLYSIAYDVQQESALVAASKRGHLMRFLAPLDVSGAEVSQLNTQVVLEPKTADMPKSSAEWQTRWITAERGADYFAAVAQFPDGSWAYSPTVIAEPIVSTQNLMAEWVFTGPKPALMGNVKGLDKPQDIIADRSIYGHDLVIPEDMGSTFIDLPGNGRALRFDGRTILKSEHDTAANGPVAVEALFRLTETGRYQVIAMQRGAQATLVVEKDGRLAALRLPENRRHPNPFVKAFSKEPLEAGRFYHAVISYNGRELSLYLDGEFQDSIACIGTRSTEGFALGGPAGNPLVTKAVDEMPANGFFTGDMVKFSVYGQAISADEVAILNQNAQLLPFWER
ncbi:LamG-like jellyroll fold domain-containing protein [Cerasicoccus arenae]|uniref:LamG-like jellyroll fold domain-containing protein n=1 Tax=Cerasicoccus arenae TaxID=424488 RepID=UPI001676C675